MHLLILPSSYPAPYGPTAGIFFKEQAEALATAGHRVGVIYPEFRSVRTLAQGKVSFGYRNGPEGLLAVYRYRGLRPPKLHRLNRWRWAVCAERLYHRYILERGAPDLIHAHSAVWAGTAAARISRGSGTPYVLTEHSSGFARGRYRAWYETFLRDAFENASAVIAVSEALRQQLAAYRPLGSIHIVPNLVDTEKFCLPPEPRPEVPLRFVCIAASLDDNKATDVLLRAFAAAFAGAESVRLDIVGDGPERTRLEHLAWSSGIGEQATFHGRLDRVGVRTVLWSAHCCVSASRVETFGVTLIEALATGLPSIATRSGGPEDIVTPESGHLVPVDDVPALAEAMRGVFAARALWGQRTAALRALAERRYSTAAIVEELGEVYRAALETLEAKRSMSNVEMDRP
jgi:glycosyltransferase involved in cell wall biosynthesis